MYQTVGSTNKINGVKFPLSPDIRIAYNFMAIGNVRFVGANCDWTWNVLCTVWRETNKQRNHNNIQYILCLCFCWSFYLEPLLAKMSWRLHIHVIFRYVCIFIHIILVFVVFHFWIFRFWSAYHTYSWRLLLSLDWLLQMGFNANHSTHGLKQPPKFFSSGFMSAKWFNPIENVTSPLAYLALCSMIFCMVSLNSSKRSLSSSSDP